MTRKRQIIMASGLSIIGLSIIALVLVLLAGKVGIVALPGVHSLFQTEGTCNTCHETWYDEASYAFNPRGNSKKPFGVTIGCAECHPIQYEEYKLSAMGSSTSPLRPGCVNCHDNPHSVFNWFKHMYLADQGWKDVQIALRDRDFYDHVLTPRLTKKERSRFIKTDSRTCRECHIRPDHQQYFKNSIGLYRADIQPHQQQNADGLTCVQCHKNLTHNLSVPATWGAKPTRAEQGDLKAGQAKAGNCIDCHGVNGNSELDMFPSLAGLDPNYLFLQLLAFKQGKRKNEMMEAMVADLSAQDMADLATYYSHQTSRPSQPVPHVLSLKQRADLEMGQSLYRANCARCHGLTGKGQGIFPALAGQYPAYFQAQMDAFQDGTRSSHSIMRDVIKGLKNGDLELIADYLAGVE